jgi:hypothetical protein
MGVTQYIKLSSAISLTNKEIMLIISMADVCEGVVWKIDSDKFKEINKRFKFSRTFFQATLNRLVQKKVIKRLQRGIYEIDENLIINVNKTN